MELLNTSKITKTPKFSEWAHCRLNSFNESYTIIKTTNAKQIIREHLRNTASQPKASPPCVWKERKCRYNNAIWTAFVLDIEKD